MATLPEPRRIIGIVHMRCLGGAPNVSPNNLVLLMKGPGTIPAPGQPIVLPAGGILFDNAGYLAPARLSAVSQKMLSIRNAGAKNRAVGEHPLP